jgi:hypothetical protein
VGLIDQALARASASMARLALLQAARASLRDASACADNAAAAATAAAATAAGPACIPLLGTAPAAPAAKETLLQQLRLGEQASPVLAAGGAVAVPAGQLHAPAPAGYSACSLADALLRGDDGPRVATPPAQGHLGWDLATPALPPADAAVGLHQQTATPFVVADALPAHQQQLCGSAAASCLGGFAHTAAASDAALADAVFSMARQQAHLYQPPHAHPAHQFGSVPAASLQQWGGSSAGFDAACLFAPGLIRRVVLPQALHTGHAPAAALSGGGGGGGGGGMQFKKTRRGCRGGRKKLLYSTSHAAAPTGAPVPGAHDGMGAALPPPLALVPQQLL